MFIKDKNLYYVGGFVRDEILGAKSFDTDFCYEGNAINFAQENNLNIIKINPDFGTVRVLFENKEVDIASTRKETYPKKGHLPKVTDIGCPLIEDLKRRDFTINAMAKRTMDGEFIDYFNGKNDIENKIIKILHKDSFSDDPTRIIRALKFRIRFGFSLENETKKLQEEYLNNINYDMSFFRLKKELVETFNLNKPEGFDIFINEGIYKLLGNNINPPSIKGEQIKNCINRNKIENAWFFYIAPFLAECDNINIPLLKSEKRILEWAEKLKTQKPANNTPKEAVILKEILDNV